MFVRMKFLFVFFMLGFSLLSSAQKVDFNVNEIALPSEIAYYDNQFSGLYIQKEKLFFLSESRLQDKAEAKLYSIKLKDIELKLTDTSFILPFKKLPIYNLDILREKMKMNGDEYEGLEAMIIDKKSIHFSVETTTASNNCYLLKGAINDTGVILNVELLKQIVKPLASDGKHIYNAGFEALAINKKSILGFFEYNYFAKKNAINKINLCSFKTSKTSSFLLEKLPFRLTDITAVGKNNFTAINYFYNGGGEDEIYRVPALDAENFKLTKDSVGYKSYTRLISINYNKNILTWKPLWDLPPAFWSYNWEGIAAYKKGYFIVNDKYTAIRPYKSVLLYLQFTK